MCISIRCFRHFLFIAAELVEIDAILHHLASTLFPSFAVGAVTPPFPFSAFLLQLTSLSVLLFCTTRFLCCVHCADDHNDSDRLQMTRTSRSSSSSNRSRGRTTTTTTRRSHRSSSRESPRSVLMRQLEMLLQNSNANNGFRACLNDGNIFKWRVFIDGPPETPYAGCTFTALLKFPASFPSYPPTMTFLTDILHPNIDTSGKVCISILHPPGIDPLGYEQASERWNCDRTVESILVSIQLLLAEPNFNSPANVDAAVLFRSDPARYREEVRRRVEMEIAAPTQPEGQGTTQPPEGQRAQPPEVQETQAADEQRAQPPEEQRAQPPEQQGTTQPPEEQRAQPPEQQGTTQAAEEQGTQPPEEQRAQPPEQQGTTQPPEEQRAQPPEQQGTTQPPEEQRAQPPEQQGTTQPPEEQGTQPPATPPPEGPQQETGEWYI
ncbi:hypothetical protein niasHT_016985 [Heterodera trifolii]|uniref:UBC core domain-containing protein n=1 Tax=Heterodera trifolii TaxID=157864 RepID=A0ABD2LBC7_9BILA